MTSYGDIRTIGFDADDTLWEHADFYRRAERRLMQAMAEHGDAEAIAAQLRTVERRNLDLYGFGVKGFTLSMVETAIEVSRGRVSAAVIDEVLRAGRELVRHPLEILPHVRETLGALSSAYRLVLISRGDLFDQERKLAESGLGDFFHAVEIVSEKDAAMYQRVFHRHGDGPQRAMMVGNSLRSDVLPALEAGSWGVHVPQPQTWVMEVADPPRETDRFHVLEHMGELPSLLHRLSRTAAPSVPT